MQRRIKGITWFLVWYIYLVASKMEELAHHWFLHHFPDFFVRIKYTTLFLIMTQNLQWTAMFYEIHRKICSKVFAQSRNLSINLKGIFISGKWCIDQKRERKAFICKPLHKKTKVLHFSTKCIKYMWILTLVLQTKIVFVMLYC